MIRRRRALELEVAAARAVGTMSRLTGRGGGTTLPGKLLWHVHPGAIDGLAARLEDGVIVLSATNGKTTTSAMTAAILGHDRPLAWNRAGANLASGVASALLATPEATLGVLEIDEFALPHLLPRLKPRVVALGNLFRDQLDRYGELEQIATRWRDALSSLPGDTTLVLNADDPLVSSLGDGRERVVRYGIDDVAHARAGLQHAADSKHCIRCGSPYRYRAAYIGHLGEYACSACGHARPPLDLAARAIEFEGRDGASFDAISPTSTTRVRLTVPGLYNVYNGLAALAVAECLGTPVAEGAEALRTFRAAFGRYERITLRDREALLLLIKNPAGANEAVRTLTAGAPPRTVLVALNDAIADGRDVSWIWDVDFELLLDHAEHVIVSGDRAAELALRFTYVGFPAERLALLPDLERALDHGLDRVGPGGELTVLPTYTAMLALRRVLTARGHTRPYWERSNGTP